MSRGPGRWQRLLLHELYHGTLKRDPFFGRLELSVWHLTSTSGEPDYSTARYTRYAAARRAGRSLIANGLATGCPLSGQAHTLYRVDPPPDITCPQCGRKCSELGNAADSSEHLNEAGAAP
jgi:hypothetical protein